MHYSRNIFVCLFAVISPSLGGMGQAISAADNAPGYQVKFETSQGDFILEVHPEWAPIGAAHFKELIDAKYYDDCRFFRVVDNFMAQVGMHGDPKTNAKWSVQTIKDEAVKQKNLKGYVSYAKTGAPNSRSTQFFINYKDNSYLDGYGFSPFAKVIKGMDVVEKLYNGYGDGPPGGKGPSQGRIRSEGNQYLKKDFPKLDYIKTARIVKPVKNKTAILHHTTSEVSALIALNYFHCNLCPLGN